jgi:hypothetical protein
MQQGTTTSRSNLALQSTSGPHFTAQHSPTPRRGCTGEGHMQGRRASMPEVCSSCAGSKRTHRAYVNVSACTAATSCTSCCACGDTPDRVGGTPTDEPSACSRAAAAAAAGAHHQHISTALCTSKQLVRVAPRHWCHSTQAQSAHTLVTPVLLLCQHTQPCTHLHVCSQQSVHSPPLPVCVNGVDSLRVWTGTHNTMTVRVDMWR